jgi:hypothetical protein
MGWTCCLNEANKNLKACRMLQKFSGKNVSKTSTLKTAAKIKGKRTNLR